MIDVERDLTWLKAASQRWEAPKSYGGVDEDALGYDAAAKVHEEERV